MKARHFSEVKKFEDIPNVGPRIAGDFKNLGMKQPQDLIGRDGFELYQKLCMETGQRHDPCVLDTFMAVTDFMNGGEPMPWFSYTAKRKRLYPDV